jgi:pyridoxamine 5'-phosphate oxidase
MIKMDRLETSEPYKKFYDLYDNCVKKKQLNPDAIVISSLDAKCNLVDSRVVNLKYILGQDWIFFTNYNSPKGMQINSHNQISAVLFWPSVNTQIRIKAKIKKTSNKFSDNHFDQRMPEKNALSISSMQSLKINSYNEVKDAYKKILSSKENFSKRPSYWGGYKFKPYEIEFWEGHSLRLNKRKLFKKTGNRWKAFTLQP